MNDYAIVVLSGYPDIFAPFFHSVLAHEEPTRLVMITSGAMSADYDEIDKGDICCVHGPEPFSFPRNANIGIRAAGRADVFLMNDDVQFLELGSVGKLARIAHEHQEVGILSPQFEGRVGNALQERAHPDRMSRMRPMLELTYSDQRLCFCGVYIRRAVLDLVGELDERFDGYGRDDDDYCRRVRNAGLKLAVTPEVVMRHGFGDVQHSASFKRLPTYPKSGMDPEMTRRYFEKWGDTR